ERLRAEELGVGLRDAAGRLAQPVALGVLAEGEQELAGRVLRALEIDAVGALDRVEEGGVHAASSWSTALHERAAGSCSVRTAVSPEPAPSRIPSTTASTSLQTSAGRSDEMSGQGQPVRRRRFPAIRASKPRRARM